MAKINFKLITFIVLITVSTLGLINAQWAIDDNGCRTPDRGVGNCVIVRECKSMIDFVKQLQSVTPEVIRVLRNYRCGFQERSVKVCCPDKPLTLNVLGRNNNRTPMPILPTIPRPPDVTNHSNIRLLPSVSECGSLSSRSRIINGYEASLFEFPWMVILSYQTRNGQAFLCGGSLINERYVLTAAHCITNLDNHTRLENVRLGEHNTSSVRDCETVSKNTIICADPVQDILIEEVIPHPSYNPKTYLDDIGLLRLSSPAQFKESVQPICLPADETLRNKNFTNAKLVVTGWGSTETVSRSENLLKVEIPIVPAAECKTAYHLTPAVISYRQLCAGGLRDTCGGDSGGPLQSPETVDDDVHIVQHGIVSFGPQRCGQYGYPGVYTRTDYYMDWILDNMRA